MLAAPLISIMASMPAKPCDDRHAAPIVDINHHGGDRGILRTIQLRIGHVRSVLLLPDSLGQVTVVMVKN